MRCSCSLGLTVLLSRTFGSWWPPPLTGGVVPVSGGRPGVVGVWGVVHPLVRFLMYHTSWCGWVGAPPPTNTQGDQYVTCWCYVVHMHWIHTAPLLGLAVQATGDDPHTDEPVQVGALFRHGKASHTPPDMPLAVDLDSQPA